MQVQVPQLLSPRIATDLRYENTVILTTLLSLHGLKNTLKNINIATSLTPRGVPRPFCLGGRGLGVLSQTFLFADHIKYVDKFTDDF